MLLINWFFPVRVCKDQLAPRHWHNVASSFFGFLNFASIVLQR